MTFRDENSNVGDVEVVLDGNGAVTQAFIVGPDDPNAATPTLGERVYTIFDGAPTQLESQIVVRSASQLAGALSSSVEYLLDGNIDMGTQSIVVPVGGLNIKGLNTNVSGLTSAEDNFTLFTDDGGAGALFLNDLFLSVTGSNSQVFDLESSTGFDPVELNGINFLSCTSIGELNNYRQLFGEKLFSVFAGDGFTFSGNWVGVSLTDFKWISPSPAFTGTIFKAGTGLTFSNRFITNINCELPSGTSSLCDFSQSNFNREAMFQLDKVNILRDGSLTVDDVNYLPNIDETDLNAMFTDCVGLRNTHPGVEMYWTAQAVNTIAAVNTPEKANGSTLTSRSVWFSATDNELTYNSALCKDFMISVYVRVDGNPNRESALIVRKWDNSLGAYDTVKESSKTVNNLVGGADVTDFTFTAIAELDTDDRIEVWIENRTDGSSMTVLQGSEIILTER